MSCNRMCTDYYKLGPEFLGWCKTCISNREGMYTENMVWYVWVHVQDADMCIKIDTYDLSKVWVRCVCRQYLVKYGSCDGCLTKYL